MEKHIEVTNLGTLAAQRRLMAVSMPAYLRPALEDQEQRLRDAQIDYLAQGIGICATEGCFQTTEQVHCEDCREEMAGTPAPMPAWAVSLWLGLSLGAIYTVALIGQGIDWSYAKHLF